MKQQINYFLGSCRYKVLAASIAALSTTLITTSVTQASDIEIYQDAKSGDVTLMFMLDISGSMTNKDGTTTSRMDKVKVAMRDLLNGNTSKGITRLGDDKIIGLSTLGARLNNTDYNAGAVLVDAKSLGYKYTEGSNIGKTHREILLAAINDLTATTNTPTARSYAETIAYLMGTTTKPSGIYQNYFGMKYVFTNYYAMCTDWNSSRNCINWEGWYQGNVPSIYTNTSSGKIDGYSGSYYSGSHIASGFDFSSDNVKSGSSYLSPSSLTQTDEIKKCSGQGIYVLTDGEPNQNAGTPITARLALNNSNFTCNNSSDGWDCTNKLNEALLDPQQNPKGLKFKTAVVGFGNSFNHVTSYDSTKTQQQNLAALGEINSDVKRAARWGILGEGGWYSGNSSQDVVDSVNEFISNLSKDIPSVTTGSPTVPRDALNPAELQDDAYYQTFQPTPNTNYQLWVGNLKKYKVGVGGVLKGRGNADVFNDNGSLVEPTYDDNGNITNATYDFWSKAIDSSVATSDENTVGSRKFAARGGAWSQLLLGAKSDNQTPQRKLLTNRKAVGSGASVEFGGSSDLRQVQLSDLTDSPYKNDSNRGHLVSLLGYNIDVDSPPTSISNLIAQPTLRQVGAVMHSYPVLVTNKGKLNYNSTAKLMESTNREDYILFGTTQGLLHVVDANTGVEKFAFVPNEMVNNQKDAFRLSSVTTGGLQKMFYGIDGPWTLDTRYVVDNSGALTVGAGRTSKQKGWQIAYGGLRMGGRSYYALDLSDIDTPALKFHIDPETQKVYSGSSSKTFSQLQYMGQSWSKPSIAWVNWGGVRKRVMFVGGGMMQVV